MSIPHFTPADLVRVPDAFDHDDFIFELKMDGFRALAYIDEHETRLVSRKGNVYRSFADLCAPIHIDLDCRAVMDGEIVCLDQEGRPQFYELMRRRSPTVFYAFDVLWIDGKDVRALPLCRKRPPTSARSDLSTRSADARS